MCMDNIKYKICALTGHRPKSFPWNYRDNDCKQHKEYLNSLERIVTELIEQEGFNYFISGGAIGADQDFAEIVIKLKKHHPNICLEIAVPCPNQDLKWNESDKRRYERIIKNADIVNIISSTYNPHCMQVRNEYMTAKCDLMIVLRHGQRYGRTYNTFMYLKRLNKPFKLISLTM